MEQVISQITKVNLWFRARSDYCLLALQWKITMELLWVSIFWISKPGAGWSAVCGPLVQILPLNLAETRAHSACTSCSPCTPNTDYQGTAKPNSCCGMKWKQFWGSSRLTKMAHYFQNPLYNSPTPPVWRLGGRQHLAIDYQLLNANTAPVRAVVPNIATLTAPRSHTPWTAVPGVTDVSFMVCPLAGGQKETFFYFGKVHNIPLTDFHRI